MLSKVIITRSNIYSFSAYAFFIFHSYKNNGINCHFIKNFEFLPLGMLLSSSFDIIPAIIDVIGQPVYNILNWFRDYIFRNYLFHIPNYLSLPPMIYNWFLNQVFYPIHCFMITMLTCNKYISQSF